MTEDIKSATFGDVLVEVKPRAGSCVITAPRPGPVMPVPTKIPLHSLDAINLKGASLTGRAQRDEVAADIVRACKFAAQLIGAAQKGRR